jgi:hypothetical protein
LGRFAAAGAFFAEGFAFLAEGLLETYFFLPEVFLEGVFLAEAEVFGGCTATAVAAATTRAIHNWTQRD